MKWTKRLKWLRISKIIIPIALAISLVFAGFSVYANQAENFVVRVNQPTDVRLLLAFNEDFSDATTHLVVPVGGKYEDVTYTPNPSLLYNDIKNYSKNLPDDIAQHEGIHSVYLAKNELSFFSFSFYLKNASERAVDIDMSLNIDEVVVADKDGAHHVDGAVRVMFIEGKPLLSDKTYTVYKKLEATPEEETDPEGLGKVAYGNVVPFVSNSCVFDRSGLTGYKTVGVGKVMRFTIVIWLEGWDPDCIDEVRFDSMKMSMDFTGY